MGIAAKTMILIEQDPSTEQRLKHPEQYTYLERRDEIEALLNGFMISLFLSAPLCSTPSQILKTMYS